jgi:hypothetical protein
MLDRHRAVKLVALEGNGDAAGVMRFFLGNSLIRRRNARQ